MRCLPILLLLICSFEASAKPFPGLVPLQKPDQPLSSATERLYDVWNPHEDRGNELYSNFKYTPLKGLSNDPNISRRDPTKVIKVEGVYHVWYTSRRNGPVAGRGAQGDQPAADWDMADIWHATSTNGWEWVEDDKPAVRRPPKPERGFRSICTPGILVWKGKYYLYFQAYSPKIGGQIYCPVRVASADSPWGPWTHHPEPAVTPGPKGSWDNIKINDPCPIVHNGQILIYYKGAPIERGPKYVLRMQGLAISQNPLGPFRKSPLNPVINSGHETGMFPWKGGVAAIVSLDGPEKNTLQFAPDGVNFEVASMIQMPPVAPGPFCPDAFADSGDGRGITWGLCHMNPAGGGITNKSILARFDCDLSQDVNRPYFKRNNLRFNAETYFQRGVALPKWLRKKILKTAENVDKETIVTE